MMNSSSAAALPHLQDAPPLRITIFSQMKMSLHIQRYAAVIVPTELLTR